MNGCPLLPTKPFTIGRVLRLLAPTPPRVTARTADRALFYLRAAPNHDEWSVNDALAHLRACADIWGSCIEATIAEEMSPLRAIDPKPRTKRPDDPDPEFRASWRAVASPRAALLAILEPLPPDGWSRAAPVTGRARGSHGPCSPLGSWAGGQRLAGHERSYLEQIERSAGGMPGSGP